MAWGFRWTTCKSQAFISMATQSIPTKAMRSEHAVPPAHEKRSPRPSPCRQFFSSKLNILLLFVLASLIVVFSCILALVVVPRFEKKSDPGSPASAVIKQNFPDPCLTYDWARGSHDGGPWYAFATRGNGVNVQVATADLQDFSNWTYLEGHDALPQPGKWVATQLSDSQVWAPSVMSKVVRSRDRIA